MGHTTVRVSDETKRRLEIEKGRRGERSHDAVISALLDESGGSGVSLL